MMPLQCAVTCTRGRRFRSASHATIPHAPSRARARVHTYMHIYIHVSTQLTLRILQMCKITANHINAGT